MPFVMKIRKNVHFIFVGTMYSRNEVVIMSDQQQIPIFVDSPMQTSMSKTQIKKMIFIMNALEKGWSVKKIEESYIFTKKHEGKREVFCENYLEKFVKSNFDTSILNDS